MSARKKLSKGASALVQLANPTVVASLLVTALQASHAPTSSVLASSAPSPAHPDTADPSLLTSKPSTALKTPDVNIPSDPSKPTESTLDPPTPQSLLAQDTPNNGLLSYQIGDLLEEEEVTSRTVALGEALDDVKTKLQDILQLLNQDISLLVQDAEGIRGIFCHLKGQLPADVEVALLPAAFIEGHPFKVLQAK
ncbi:hypothetical protein C2845_PM12G14810 [Panicum miliaceum]|uniref:Uncharacterized protein n=1 Tax=Panicum miliaceum TaxID=4540 RepID=A0A3L6QIU0_PANMI|nr:hypothetical protein C2845_PM12G14810 [Panicum miliaceum]